MNYLQSVVHSFDFTQPLLKLEEKLTSTVEQQAAAKIALMILAVFLGLATVFMAYKAKEWGKIVTVEDATGATSKAHIDTVNGKVKVTWSGFMASGAVCVGEFTKGKMDGPGKITYPIGSIAEEQGKFKNGYLNDDHGKRIHRNGTVQEGKFIAGIFMS